MAEATQQQATPRTPLPDLDDTDRVSFLKTRIAVGVIGVLFAPVVVLGDRFVSGGQWLPSLSDYYYASTRDWFVGSLWAIGSGLLVYLAARRHAADGVVSFVAGLFAIGVSLFPTNHPPDVPVSVISILHLVFAGGLFLLLVVICCLFGLRNGNRADRTPRWRRLWRRIHLGCAGVIAGSLAAGFLVGAHDPAGPAVLVGEMVAVTTFGISWFLEVSQLFKPVDPVQPLSEGRHS